MMAKPLNLIQSITDGASYSVDRVCYFKDRNPGLDTLSRCWDWTDQVRQRRWIAPLAGREWQGTEGKDELTRLALEHIQNFWKPYGVDFPFQVDHKNQRYDQEGHEVPESHWIAKMAWWSKADYAFLLPSGEIVYVGHSASTARRLSISRIALAQPSLASSR
jgi:hypothetical protein